METVQPGDLVPDFAVTRTDGSPWRYSQIWQRKNLLLLALPPNPDAAAHDYAARFDEYRDELQAMDTAFVVTSDDVSGVPAPGVLVVDRWGEVRLSAHAAKVSDLPDPIAVLEQLRGIDYECPECEGETR